MLVLLESMPVIVSTCAVTTEKNAIVLVVIVSKSCFIGEDPCEVSPSRFDAK
jgi:hypothetical protein